jgi:hypothetical protein
MHRSIHTLLAPFALFALLAPLRAGDQLPQLPQPATSFGATIANGWLYIYGGNTGKAHEFHRDCVKGDLFRLAVADLSSTRETGGADWEKLTGGLELLSPALVSFEGKVIRLGGMHARNEKGAKNDLHSTDQVMRYDSTSARWEPLPPLPEPRSSHDAAILGHVLYLGGGWSLSGDDGDGARARWCDTLLSIDLHALEKGWRSQPQPFQRRAVAVVAHEGRIWFIGGMDNQDKQSRQVDWFEPATGAWGHGPELPESPMAGFGIAAAELQGSLYVSPLSGTISRLSTDGSQWEEDSKLRIPRFFHRLLPLADGRLLAIGGSNKQGQVRELEVIAVQSRASSAQR